jgi:hypothetical protein
MTDLLDNLKENVYFNIYGGTCESTIIDAILSTNFQEDICSPSLLIAFPVSSQSRY